MNKLISLFLITSIFFSCNYFQTDNAKSEKFIGTWNLLGGLSQEIHIVRSGKNIILKLPNDVSYAGKYDSESDILIMNINGKSIEFIYDHTTTNLITSTGSTYKKNN
jgi:hypothetical protein